MACLLRNLVVLNGRVAEQSKLLFLLFNYIDIYIYHILVKTQS